jgi:PhzF family phenazine biosynthesis protein
MPELPYHLVDVFTDMPFGGNQLAVFTEPDDLPAETMQLIARELNLSETTFVLPPTDPQNHYRVRIFTPARELPFAGHPTIGTGYVLHRHGLIRSGGSLRLEEGVGVIEVTLTPESDGRLMVTMRQPLPQFGAIFEDRATLSAILSLKPDDLTDGLPAQVVSSGLPFLFIPVKTLSAIRRVQTPIYGRGRISTRMVCSCSRRKSSDLVRPSIRACSRRNSVSPKTRRRVRRTDRWARTCCAAAWSMRRRRITWSASRASR